MNNKITIYELLGLVKDRKAPKRIKHDNLVYEWLGDLRGIGYANGRLPSITWLVNKLDIEDSDVLNSEVEILDNEDEEKKIPEKLKLYTLSDNDSADFTTLQDFNNRDIQKTINWILDYLKSKGE